MPRAFEGFTVKEMLVSLDRDLLALAGELRGYIAIHQNQHIGEQNASNVARSDPDATAAGQSLRRDVGRVVDAGRDTRTIVDRHDILIQRITGAVALASFMGLSGVVIGILMIAGWVGPTK